MQHVELQSGATALAAPGPLQTDWTIIHAARAANDATSSSWKSGEPLIILEHIAALHTEPASVLVSSHHVASAYRTAGKFSLVDSPLTLCCQRGMQTH
jgi:hypothetical protein